jgi:cell division protein FtsW (lipid II flippase)
VKLETVSYLKDPERYDKALEGLQKDLDIELTINFGYSNTITAFILGILASLVVITLPNAFQALINICTSFLQYFMAGKIFELIGVVIGILLLIIISLILWIVPTKITRTPYVQSKLSKYLGVTNIEKILEVSSQLLLAKTYPEHWDLQISIDPKKRTMKFVTITPHNDI